jgi:hypothetical protein
MLPDPAYKVADYSCRSQRHPVIHLTPTHLPHRFHPRHLQGKDSTWEQEDDLILEKNEMETSEHEGEVISEKSERTVLEKMVKLDTGFERMARDVS